MMYAPRALRHFSLAALEGHAHRVEGLRRQEPLRAVPAKVGPMRTKPPRVVPSEVLPPRGRTVVRLWIPATPIFLLLAPFALLLAPLIYLAPRPYRLDPLAAVLGLGRLLLSLGGTVVDVDTPEALVRIRIF